MRAFAGWILDGDKCEQKLYYLINIFVKFISLTHDRTLMAVLELPSGQSLNPLFLRGIKKHSHFWGDKFYLTLQVQGEGSIEIESLTEAEADRLQEQIRNAIDGALAAATIYDEASEAGRHAGFIQGHKSGFSEGFNEAKSTFWSYDREEYRINEYNLGYEAGRTDEKENGSYDEFCRGLLKGKEDMTERYLRALKVAKDEVLDLIARRYVLATTFTLQQLEMSLDLMDRVLRRHIMTEEESD